MNGSSGSQVPFAYYLPAKWAVVILLLVAALVNYMDRATLSIGNSLISDSFGLNPFYMGLLLSAFMWPYALASLPAGWLVDHFGIQRMFIISVLLWAVSAIGGGLAFGFFSMYAARVLLGIAEAPFFIIAGKVTRDYFAPRQRGMVASLINTGPRIANGLGPPILAGLMVYLGWRGMFISLGLAGIVIVVLWQWLYRPQPLSVQETRHIHKEETAADYTKSNTAGKVSRVRFWRLFCHPSVILFNLGNIGSSYIYWLYLTWLPYYLMDNRGLSAGAMGIVMAIPFSVAIGAVLLGGWLSDYCIRRGFSVVRGRLVPVVAGCLIAGIVVFPLNAIVSTPLLITLISISVFCLELRPGVLWALVGDLAPFEAVGLLGGIQNFANFVGATLAPSITGLVLTLSGHHFTWVFIISGILCLGAALCYALIRKPVSLSRIKA